MIFELSSKKRPETETLCVSFPFLSPPPKSLERPSLFFLAWSLYSRCMAVRERDWHAPLHGIWWSLSRAGVMVLNRSVLNPRRCKKGPMWRNTKREMTQLSSLFRVPDLKNRTCCCRTWSSPASERWAGCGGLISIWVFCMITWIRGWNGGKRPEKKIRQTIAVVVDAVRD